MSQVFYKKDHIVTSVVAVIIDEEERVLLTKRKIAPFQDLWVMPGGKIDLGEPILKALHREVMEEVGLRVEAQGLVDVFEHLTPGAGNSHFVILYYRCTPLSKEVVHNGHEVDDFAWVPRAELLNYNMPDGTKYILGKIFPELCACDI